MNIPDILHKIKYLGRGESEGTISFNEEGEVVHHSALDKFFMSAVIILVGLLCFSLGRLTQVGDKGEMKLYIDPNVLTEKTNGSKASSIAASEPDRASIVDKSSVSASSKGTKYYFSYCKNTISEKNRVTFATPSLAEAAGYTLATNCLPR